MKFVFSLISRSFVIFIFTFIYFIFDIAEFCFCVGFSPVVESGGCSLAVACRLLMRWLLSLQGTGSGSQAPEVAAPGLWSTGSVLWCMSLVALLHVESSQIRDCACVSCIGRQILYQWAPERPQNFSFHFIFDSITLEEFFPFKDLADILYTFWIY